MKLIVLMSTYNGEKYIRRQLDSLLNQDFKIDRIMIRDDGSRDDTVGILEEYASEHSFIKYYCGKNVGVYKSFYELIRNSEDADYYALCDQDDVWFKDKLSTAVKCLDSKDNSIPQLYCSRYTLTDKDLNPINSDVSKLYDYTDFNHSLIYHTAPGCTFVFNHEARLKVLKYDMNKEYTLIHDAIIHKVVAMFGEVTLDHNSHMFYRQHNNNQIGMSADKLKVFVGRVNNFVSGRIRNYRSKTAEALLRIYGDQIDDEKKRLLNILANYKKDPELKKQLLNEKSFKTGTINDYFFRLLVLANYI